MSEIKVNAAVCEICGGKLVFRGEDNFECESCGIVYPKDWVKAKVQEIKGTVTVEGAVEVAGVENADTLYKRALDYLNINKRKNSFKVLQEMTDKYPGDKRGWIELVQMWPADEPMRVLRHFNDEDTIAAERRIVEHIQNHYDKIRSGKIKDGEFWILSNGYSRDKVCRVLPSEYICPNPLTSNEGKQIIEFVDTVVPYAKTLHEEGKANAKYFCELMYALHRGPDYANSRRKIFDELCKIWKLGQLSHNTISRCEKIVGQIIFYDYHDGYDDSGSAIIVADIIITKSVIQQAFLEIDMKLFNGANFKYGLCNKCGIPKKEKGVFNKTTYCPNCEKG